MNAATLLQATFCYLFVFVICVQLCWPRKSYTLQTHRPQVSTPLPPYSLAIAYLAWKFPLPISLTEIMLPQMCELLMSFSQFATWAILPVLQSVCPLPLPVFQVFHVAIFTNSSSFACALHMCLCVCVCVCTLIIFTWQMLRFKCSNNNSCTYAHPETRPDRTHSQQPRVEEQN